MPAPLRFPRSRLVWFLLECSHYGTAETITAITAECRSCATVASGPIERRVVRREVRAS